MTEIQSNWDYCLELADVVCAHLGLDVSTLDFVQGEFICYVEQTDEEAIITFPEGDPNSIITVYFKEKMVVNKFLSWAVTEVPMGTGEAVAAACGGTVDEISADDATKDSLYMKDVPPGPNVPPVFGCSLPLGGKSIRVPLHVMLKTTLSLLP